ncbi:hypothetical protein JXA48_00485 [Candidatus Woesearchaeota archaeon]|nr:hypothetical protein [Candidatus Woesearchaeota archaeon]
MINTKNFAILLGGISLICYPVSLIFKTTIIYFIAKGVGIAFALAAGYVSLQAMKKKDKTIGILGINLAVIDLFIHLMPF